MKHTRAQREDDLFLCTVCGAGEGELATECPGKPATEAQREATYQGKADFINGDWVIKGPPACPRPHVIKGEECPVCHYIQ